MFEKYEVWYNGRRCGYIWAIDEFDARQRFASRHGLDVKKVVVSVLITMK